MTETPNYKLTQWTETDRILMEDFNDDNAKLDAALKAHDTAIAARARTAALDAETAARTRADSDEAAIRAKADSDEAAARAKAVSDEVAARKSAISAEASARTSAVNALNAAVAKLGNCQLYYTTYTGAATITKNNPRIFNFPHPPRLIFVTDTHGSFLYAIPSMTNYSKSSSESYIYSWSGNSFGFYGNDFRMDARNEPYFVVALLDASK